MSIGEKIKQLREERGLTQDELAKSLKIKQQSIAAWERSVANPRKVNIDKLARFFNVEAGFFFNNVPPTNKDIPLQSNYLIATEEEKSIIEKYRQLDDRGKRRILRAVNDEYDDMIEDKGIDSKNA